MSSSPEAGEEAPKSIYSVAGLRLLREEAAQRMGKVVAAVKRWWSSISGACAPGVPAPKRPEEAAQALALFDQRLAVRESTLVASLAKAKHQAEQFAQEADDFFAIVEKPAPSNDSVPDQLESEDDKGESEEAIRAHLHGLRLQESVTRNDLAKMTEEFALRERFNDLAKAHVHRAGKRLKRLEAKIATETNELKRERLQTRLETIRSEQRIRRRVFEAIATVQVPWKSDVTLNGRRLTPPGLFSTPVQSLLGPATIVGAGGSLAEVDWSDAEVAIEEATKRLVEQTPAIKCGGPKKHVGHLVIAMPQWEGNIPFVLTPEAAMRLARQGLLSQGADPDLHDFVVFVHQRRVANGDDHDEEAIHVLWSKVRIDGKYLVNDNALISAVVGRIRWDAAAGFDDQRMDAPGKEHYCVRRGLRALGKVLLVGALAKYRETEDSPYEIPQELDEAAKKTLRRRLAKLRKDPAGLGAVYRGESRREDEQVDFFGRDFLNRLAAEGSPEDLVCAGIWTPKRSYRSAESIADILAHLYGG